MMRILTFYRDPEKANLLKEKQEYRKRKQYFGSRSKSDHAARSCDSSSLRNKNHKYKHSEEYRVKDPVQDEERQYTQCRAQSISDKKDSWWFWADTQSQKPKVDEDTCSCVSCALKQMVTSEYTCITCLALIFILTVVVAFYLVFRTVPIANNDVRPDIERKLDSEGLRKKIEMLNSKRVGVKEYAAYRGSYDERKDWDDTISAQLDELPSLSGTEQSGRFQQQIQ
ncbi:uncharacterized protein LOC131852200 [Achroia grisella]|uniref:uncharacterized protein LOC131852200 n=1 Tax=Achroia grisella TaxID=688607 RepID=UPI0027D2B654|nr:uncharacterized protein LOC131852200 [Achroia grisella]